METVLNCEEKRKSFFDRVKGFKDGMERFCSSKSFIFIVALITFIFHALALDFWGIALYALSAALFFTVFKDFRPGLTILLSAIFIVSTKNSPGYGTGDNYYTNPKILYPLIGVVAVAVIALAVRCVRYRKNFLSGKSYIPLLILALALTLSGVGRQYYKQSFSFGLLMGLTYVGIYALLMGTVEKHDELLDYLATLLSAICLLIAVQVAFLYFMHLVKGGTFDAGWKGQIIVGWGVSNIVGEMIVFFMPFVMYKTEHSKKHYTYYNLIGLFAMTMLVFTLNRTGMLFGFPIYAVLWVRLLIKSRNRGKLFLTALIYFSLGVIFLSALMSLTELSEVFIYFKDMFNEDEGVSLSARDDLWKQAFAFFKDSPWVGEGFARSFNEQIYSSNRATMFQTLSHNFIIQSIGSGGIMGITVMLGFVVYMAMQFFKKYEGKFHFVCFAVLYALISLFDTTYFITYSVMFLMLITVVQEKMVADKNKGHKQPKVLVRTDKK